MRVCMCMVACIHMRWCVVGYGRVCSFQSYAYHLSRGCHLPGVRATVLATSHVLPTRPDLRACATCVRACPGVGCLATPRAGPVPVPPPTAHRHRCTDSTPPPLAPTSTHPPTSAPTFAPTSAGGTGKPISVWATAWHAYGRS